jgi:hypothetical protein
MINIKRKIPHTCQNSSKIQSENLKLCILKILIIENDFKIIEHNSGEIKILFLVMHLFIIHAYMPSLNT